MNLYLIAIVPHQEVRAIVKSLKEEIHANFGAKHALKSPAHITLQMPFKRAFSEEDLLIRTLGDFSARQTGFEVQLDGFDCFEPRVIFLKVTDHKPIQFLHEQLNTSLLAKGNFKPDELTQQIHPHITIATRDLSKDAFYKAWPLYEHRKFSASFFVNRIFLLKHNGKNWDIFKEFEFKKNQVPDN